ncbi:MAG: CBS domain-containing protein [Candidatus Levybacteria bacterium]|nr:CBS domain-containing protein [Candidatus Levybacteria bacterium]
MKVSDAMSKNVDSVRTDTKVKDVSLLIFGRGINGVPVLKGKKVVGFITERDILAKFYPSISEYAEDPFREGNFEEMEDKVDEIFEMPADKIMSTQVTLVTPNTPLLRAQSRMFIEKVGRLPVIDKSGNLVGIISKGDIFRTLVGDRLLFTENEEYNDWLSKTYYASVDIKDRLGHEVPDLLKIFAQNEVKRILDIGCGTGDHAIDFARRGFEVVGIDRSQGMIREANKRRQVLSKEASERLKFYCSDLESFIPKIKTTFDAALFLGNTISHNPHNYQELIARTSKHLSEKGVMVLQITNFNKILKVRNRILGLNFAVNKAEPNREYAFVEFYDNPSDHGKTILKTFAILTSDGGKRWKSTGVRNSVMAYLNKDKINAVLKRNGFSKISVFGGAFDGRHWDFLFRKPFKELESDWLNVVAIR